MPFPGTGAKLMLRIRAATSTAESTPPRLSTGSSPSFTWAGDQQQGEHEGDDRQGQRHEEHRAPPVVLEQGAGHQRPEGGDRTAERGPQGDGLGPSRARRPQRGDQRQRRRVGHAGREATEDAGGDQHADARRVGGDQAGGNREHHAGQAHPLAAVAVADGSQVQHRGRQAQRVADRGQVQRRLGGVERLADVGERHVRHREVQVRDRGDEDQRKEDGPAARRRRTGGWSGVWRGGHGVPPSWAPVGAGRTGPSLGIVGRGGPGVIVHGG